MRENWRFKALGDVCHVIGGGTPSKKKAAFYDGEIPWATVRDMKEGILSHTEFCISKEAVQHSSTNIIPAGNVVIATRVGLGKVCLLNQDTAINQDLRGIIPNESIIDVRYLFRWFQSVSDVIQAEGTGATVKGVKLPFIKSLKVPVPPLDEQKRIAAILDEAFAGIEKAVANTEKNLANARELFESYLSSLFLKHSEKWDWKILEDVCENLDSKRVPITKSKRKPGKIPYYGASGVVDYVDDYLFDEDLLLISEDGANLLARTYPIAFSISGKSWVNNHAHVLRFSNYASQKFIEYYLNSIPLTPYVTGMAQPKLNQKALNSIPVPFPPINIQHDIVRKLDELSDYCNSLVKVNELKIASFAELKQSLLQKAFSGELTANANNKRKEAAA
ncbi:MAG: restriction endonuclease subunit S [Desulfobacterales bacterium]